MTAKEDKFQILQEQVHNLTEQMLRMMETMEAMRQTTSAAYPVSGDKDFRPVVYNQVNEQEISQNNFQISGQRSNSKHESECD